MTVVPAPQSTEALVPAFLAAARFAGGALSEPEVGAAWEEPSALPRMTVGDVAGHLFLVVRRVGKHLEQPPPPPAPDEPLARMGYPRVDRPEDLELEVHTTVRVDGHHVAGWGWSDVREAYAARVATVADQLAGTVPEVVVAGTRRMDTAEYLGSRIVEVLVHADDLLVSAGLDRWDPPAEALDAALVYSLGVARRVHGDRALLRAFTRRERVPPGAPSIF